MNSVSGYTPTQPRAGSSRLLRVEIQWSCTSNSQLPSDADLAQWAEVAVLDRGATAEVTIRVVDKAEMREANQSWREKDRPTNVLSFPAEFPPQAGINYLGDLLICADVLEEESREQQKSLFAHWAHIVVHGMLHLQGFDHINEQDANEMERIEVEILESIGYNNPYRA